jgi:phytoene synthase
VTALLAADAYDVCRRVARASGSSFYRGMSLLASDRRDAIFAVYALARRIDDVADGPLERDAKLARLADIRAAVAAIGESRDPVLVALADAARRLPIPLEAFADLLDGAEMDVRGVSFGTFAELELYCRRVAGSIGRLALGVFETSDRGAAVPLADDLGVALQLGNIVRDLSEDLPLGRVYLPTEDLVRFSCSVRAGTLDGPAELLVAFEAERALGWLRRGLALVGLLDRRSAAAVLAMAESYRLLLEHIAFEPRTVLRTRPALRRWEKGWVLARSLAGVGG